MGKLDMSKVKKLSEDISKSQNGFDKLVKGKNVRRILFPKGETDYFVKQGFVHFNVGPDKQMVACPKTEREGAKCPICEYVEELKKSKDKNAKKEADSLRRVRRNYVNVLNRDAEEEEPMILHLPQSVLKGILELLCDPDYSDITDYASGRDITITRKGEGLSTEYSVLPKVKISIASEDLTEDELDEKMTDLESLFDIKSYDELEAILNGEDEEEDEEEFEEDEDELDFETMTVSQLKDYLEENDVDIPVKTTRSKLVALAISVSEGDHEEEDEEEEPKPKAKKSSKKKAKEVEEDEDEEEDEEEDEVSATITNALKNRKSKKKSKKAKEVEEDDEDDEEDIPF